MQSASLYFDKKSDGKMYRESCWYIEVQPGDFHLNHGATWRWMMKATPQEL